MREVKLNFEEYSSTVVKDFLETIVIVDDQASFGKEASKSAANDEEDSRTVVGDVVEGGQRPASEGSKGGSGNAIDDPNLSDVELQGGKTGSQPRGVSSLKPPMSDDENFVDHGFNAKKAIDCFTQEGMICSVLKPNNGRDPNLTQLIRLAGKADVLILDWQLDDSGSNASEIIKKVLEEDEKSGPRLRLIIVYSAEKNLSELAQGLRNELDGRYKITDNGFTLLGGHTRISFFGKEGLGAKTPGLRDRIARVDELPNIVCSEFAKITSSFIANLVLKALSAIRKNSHQLLGYFSKEIDAAYFSHRALQPHPEDAEQYMLSIVHDELMTIMEAEDIFEPINQKNLKCYFESDLFASYDQREMTIEWSKKDSHDLTTADLMDIALNGYKKSDLLNKYVNQIMKGVPLKDRDKRIANKREALEKKIVPNLTDMFKQADDRIETDLVFSELSILKKRYGENTKQAALTLGTIVMSAEGSKHKYWVCIQPRCDSVRIKETTKFLFLSAELAEEESSFDIVIRQDDGFIKLKTKQDVSLLKTIRFEPDVNGNDTIQPLSEDGRFVYTDIDSKKYIWLGELKDNHAQRLANRFAAQLSRVGLDEYEWLRRNAK